MSVTSPKDPTESGAEKASRVRQRQRLIEACISALYAYGPSRTTVEKVVSIANLSPGIVNFYFESKAAMMVAALEFLADEFEREVIDPLVASLEDPVRALTLLVDLYLDPDIASPRKVTVWFAFWGEASARKEYYDICGKRDDAFAAVVHDLVERMIRLAGETHLDADGVSLGLIGALDILWQHFAFQVEANIDRVDARRRCMAYLASVFPGHFGSARARAPALPALPAEPSPYADPARFAIEREPLFLGAWQLAGAEAALAGPGDFLAAELLGERALVLRDPEGSLAAFRNACRRRPHALTQAKRGSFALGIACAVDGLAYGHDGAAHGHEEGALARLGLHVAEGLVFLALRPGAAPEPPDLPPGLGLGRLEPEDAPVDIPVAADWKIVVETWLDQGFDGDRRRTGPVAPDSVALDAQAGRLLWQGRVGGDEAGPWSVRRYRRLAEAAAWRRLVLFPNHLIERRPDGATLLQALPVAAGQSVIRLYRLGDKDAAAPLRHLGRRLERRWLAEDAAIAASTQAGMVSPYALPGAAAGGAVAAFRQWLETRLAQG